MISRRSAHTHFRQDVVAERREREAQLCDVTHTSEATNMSATAAAAGKKKKTEEEKKKETKKTGAAAMRHLSVGSS